MPLQRGGSNAATADDYMIQYNSLVSATYITSACLASRFAVRTNLFVSTHLLPVLTIEQRVQYFGPKMSAGDLFKFWR